MNFHYILFIPLVKFFNNEEDTLKFGLVKISHQWLLLLEECYYLKKKKKSSTLHCSLLIIILVYKIESFKRACIIKTCLKMLYAQFSYIGIITHAHYHLILM